MKNNHFVRRLLYFGAAVAVVSGLIWCLLHLKGMPRHTNRQHGVELKSSPKSAKIQEPSASSTSPDDADKETNPSQPVSNTAALSTRGSTFDQLLGLSVAELWRQYRAHDTPPSTHRAILGKAISCKLQMKTELGDSVYTEIASVVLNPAADEGLRMRLVGILAESGSAEALRILLDSLKESNSRPFVRKVIEGVSYMGSRIYTERDDSAVTDVARSYWQEFSASESAPASLYNSLSGVVARIGTAEGVQFLLSEAIRGGTDIEALEKNGSEASIAAMNASRGVRGGHAIPALQQSLRLSDPMSTEFIWTGQALASLGRPEATSALIEWAQTAPDSCAQLAGVWLSSVRDSRSQALMRQMNSTGKTLQFRSASVRDAVFAAASKFEAPR